MVKNSTHNLFSYSTKTLLVAILLCTSLLLGAAHPINKSIESGIQVKSIKCYPNPAVSFINVELPAAYVSKGFSLQVFSFTGKKMYEWNVTNPKLTINFSNDFYRGIYIFQLRDANGRIVETGKFQINK